MGKHPEGIASVLKMIQDGTFDEKTAEKLLSGVDVNAPITDLRGYETNYLYEAAAHNNLSAVKFLFEHGADPNITEPDSPLWNLQYIDEDQDPDERYKIAKLFFAYGADPNLIDEEGGETLWDYVSFKYYNDIPRDGADDENMDNFYKLLIAYGGGKKTGTYRHKDIKDIDLSKIDDYMLYMWSPDDYHICAKLIDEEGNTLVEL